MLAIRDLVFMTAQRMGFEQDLVESLKWGEPSYTCPQGSTLRIDWKEKAADYYRMFFHCQTNLVETFRKLYPQDFYYEGNRAIRVLATSEPDLGKLAHCVELSLNYHLVKHLPNLGVVKE
ncbi:MAG: DUF1801 domain-containing protein [Roseibacillus sp.]